MHLGAGTYLLEIYNSNNVSPVWGWSGNEDGDCYLRYNGSTGPWETLSINLAFQITGESDASAVPDPGAVLLFLPALAVVGLLRRCSA